MTRNSIPAVLLALMLLIGLVGYNALRLTEVIGVSAQSAPTATAVSESALISVPAGASVFQIQPGRTSATFTLTEDLHGAPNTVVGQTSQVSGQLALDPSDPATAQAGAVTVDARTLATDDSQRNRMIQSFILSTNQYPSIIFTPTSISDTPTDVPIGQPFSAQISGLLTIRDQTKPLTFNATLTEVSADELDGQATATINRTDWGIQVPSMPLVANVSDQVQLGLNFVATAQ